MDGKLAVSTEYQESDYHQFITSTFSEDGKIVTIDHHLDDSIFRSEHFVYRANGAYQRKIFDANNVLVYLSTYDTAQKLVVQHPMPDAVASHDSIKEGEKIALTMAYPIPLTGDISFRITDKLEGRTLFDSVFSVRSDSVAFSFSKRIFGKGRHLVSTHSTNTAVVIDSLSINNVVYDMMILVQ